MNLTLGIEDELQVVDARHAGLVAHDVERARMFLPDADGTTTIEAHQCVIELQTPICNDIDHAISAVERLRKLAARRCAEQEQLSLAAGLHPFSDPEDQSLNLHRNRHYLDLRERYGMVTNQALTFGLHFHLGLPAPELRMPVMNALRTVLPELLAMSCSSPFFRGQVTGLHSWRHSQLELYPRMGIPDLWASDHEYFRHLQRLRDTGCVAPHMGLWEDMRLHHRYGTIEVRICDATPSLDLMWLIGACLEAEVLTLMHELRNGKALSFVPRPLVEENKWRARRYGLRANLVDWQHDLEQSTAARYQAWLERIANVAKERKTLHRIEMGLQNLLERGNSAEHQLTHVAQHGISQDLIHELAQQTAQPCSVLEGHTEEAIAWAT